MKQHWLLCYPAAAYANQMCLHGPSRLRGPHLGLNRRGTGTGGSGGWTAQAQWHHPFGSVRQGKTQRSRRGAEGLGDRGRERDRAGRGEDSGREPGGETPVTEPDSGSLRRVEPSSGVGSPAPAAVPSCRTTWRQSRQGAGGDQPSVPSELSRAVTPPGPFRSLEEWTF